MHVVDPVPRHVSVAAALPGVTAAVGDARSLVEDDDSVDLCLGLGPLYHLEAEFTGPLAEALASFVRTGEVPAGVEGFPLRHGHVADELAGEARDAGWFDVHVLTVEGPAGHAVDLVAPAVVDPAVEQAAAVARLVEEDSRMVDVAAHLIVTGRVR